MTEEQYEALESHVRMMTVDAHFMRKCFESLCEKQFSGVEKDIIYLLGGSMMRLQDSTDMLLAVFEKLAEECGLESSQD